MEIYDSSFILGQAEREFGAAAETYGNSDLGKEDFLTLLVVQLTNQDPLNPMDDKEFTAQLAEFSSLEQLTNINEGITALGENADRQEILGAVGYLGKTVRAGGSSMALVDGDSSTLYYGFEETASSVLINIYDPNGNLVRTDTLEGAQPGVYEYEWDGKDWTGKDLPDGVYLVGLAAIGADGESMLVQTEVSGEVAGVQTYGDTFMLRLKDGRYVDFNNVYEIVDPNETILDESETTEGSEE